MFGVVSHRTIHTQNAKNKHNFSNRFHKDLSLVSRMAGSKTSGRNAPSPFWKDKHLTCARTAVRRTNTPELAKKPVCLEFLRFSTFCELLLILPTFFKFGNRVSACGSHTTGPGMENNSLY